MSSLEFPQSEQSLFFTAPFYGTLLQTFELSVAQYISQTWATAMVAFLYQLNGANLSPTQADPYIGRYGRIPHHIRIPHHVCPGHCECPEGPRRL